MPTATINAPPPGALGRTRAESITAATILDRVLPAVAAELHVTEAQILSRQRPAQVAWARQLTMHLLARQGFSTEQIATALDRHRSTVLHNLQAAADILDAYPKAVRQLCRVQEALGAQGAGSKEQEA